MCEAATIVGGLGSAASFIGGTQNANAVAKHQRQIAARNSANARTAAKNAYYQSQVLELQEAAKAGAEISATAREATQARSTTVAAAAEAGISGNSLDAILDDFSAAQGRHNATVRLNQQYVAENAEIRRQDIRLGLDGRLINSTPSPVKRPNFAAAALGAFGTALEGSEGLQNLFGG